MGADMIVTTVAHKKDATIDWEAGDAFLAKLKIDDDLVGNMEDWGHLDEDCYDDDGKPIESKIREWISGNLAEFQACLDSREVAVISVRDLYVFITGGMSWGDDTDAGYVFRKVSSIPGLLGSLGFVEDFYEEEKPVTPEEEAAAVQSITSVGKA